MCYFTVVVPSALVLCTGSSLNLFSLETGRDRLHLSKLEKLGTADLKQDPLRDLLACALRSAVDVKVLFTSGSRLYKIVRHTVNLE